MTKHSPLSRLHAAKRQLTFTEQNCPHWDYTEDGRNHTCCHELHAVQLEVCAARRAYAVYMESGS